MNNRTKGPMHFYLDGPVRARRRGALPPIHTRRNEALPDRRSPSVNDGEYVIGTSNDTVW